VERLLIDLAFLVGIEAVDSSQWQKQQELFIDVDVAH
jgi:hypothetical protein